MEITRQRAAEPNALLKNSSITKGPSSSPGALQPGSSHRIKVSAEAARTIPRLDSRWPVFEIVLLLVAAALGWSALHIYTTLNDWERRAVVAQNSAVQDTQEIQEILKLQALIDVKDRYAGLADQIERGVAELRGALENFVREKDRADIGRYLRKSQALGLWIRNQQESVDSRKLQSLRDWLATRPPTPVSNSQGIPLDLGELFMRTSQTYSNYLAAIRLVEGLALTPDLVQQKLDKASGPEKELFGLAGQASKNAAAIAAFVEQRPADTARQARRLDNDERLTSFVGDARASLRPLFYVLAITLIVQCVLLIVGLYGRVVVAPLRQKLVEDNTAIEHQRKLDHFARLATGLAHEIRNPLTAINVRLFTLQKGMGKGTNEHSDAALIRNEIDRLEQILKNFLKLARPTEPKFAILTAEPALREVRDLLAPQLQRQAIELKIDSMANTRFHADPLQLKQVLINLIQNAADSIGRRGAITLRARQDEVRLSDHPVESVILEVEDTGPGIALEVQERLFDPFFSTKENGTGLGLPIAAKIIDQHKGILDFETRPGHGTTFRVILPMATQQ